MSWEQEFHPVNFIHPQQFLQNTQGFRRLLVFFTLQVKGKTSSSSVFSNSCDKFVVHFSDTLLMVHSWGFAKSKASTAGLPTSSKSNVLMILMLWNKAWTRPSNTAIFQNTVIFSNSCSVYPRNTLNQIYLSSRWNRSLKVPDVPQLKSSLLPQAG